MIDHLTRII